MSILAIKLSEFCWSISFTKSNGSLTGYSLEVNCLSIGTRNLTILYVGDPMAESIFTGYYKLQVTNCQKFRSVTSFSVVAAMLLIMVKTNVTLRFVSLNVSESLHIQVKTSSLPKDLPCVIICYFIINCIFWRRFCSGQWKQRFLNKLARKSLIHRDEPWLNKTSGSVSLMLRRIIFVASRHCIALQSPLISAY